MYTYNNNLGNKYITKKIVHFVDIWGVLNYELYSSFINYAWSWYSREKLQYTKQRQFFLHTKKKPANLLLIYNCH